jgi:hypothetical protein
MHDYLKGFLLGGLIITGLFHLIWLIAALAGEEDYWWVFLSCTLFSAYGALVVIKGLLR